MEVYSIGFTQTNAERFFARLKNAKIGRLLDVRLNNTSQLAGWAKQTDLPYFLRELVQAEYVHELLLAPTADLLTAYKKNGGDWAAYETAFNALLAAREIETRLSRDLFFDRPTALLCSEATAEFCHRRLVLEYLCKNWGPFVVIHL